MESTDHTVPFKLRYATFMLHDVAEPVNSAEQVQHWAEMDDGRMVPPVDALKR